MQTLLSAVQVTAIQVAIPTVVAGPGVSANTAIDTFGDGPLTFIHTVSVNSGTHTATVETAHVSAGPWVTAGTFAGVTSFGTEGIRINRASLRRFVRYSFNCPDAIAACVAVGVKKQVQ